MHAHNSEICSRLSPISPLRSTDFGVVTYLARLATPNADWEFSTGCKPTQCPNYGWHRHRMLYFACFHTHIPNFRLLCPPFPQNVIFCLLPMAPRADYGDLFVALHSAESRESYSKRSYCWQNAIGARAAAICNILIHAAGERD